MLATDDERPATNTQDSGHGGLEDRHAVLKKAYCDYWRGYREHTSSPDWPRNGQYPPVPEAIRGLTCGARTRAGTPCKRIDLYWSGRCKFHGGLSTGPTTEIGKAKSRDNGKLGGRGRVSKPNSVETPRKPQGGALFPGPARVSLEPNPMETRRNRIGSVGISSDVTARFTNDPTPATDDKDFGTENRVSQPNPVETLQKLSSCGDAVGIHRPADHLRKLVLLNAQNGKVSVRVQCRDCANISAGFKCLSPGSGQSIPALGEWRICQQFLRLFAN